MQWTTRPAKNSEPFGLNLRYNDDVRCVILTAAGERAFSTGVDITGSWKQPESPFMVDDPISTVGPKSNDYWRPVIAAVNGMAAGGRLLLAGRGGVHHRLRQRHLFRPPREPRHACGKRAHVHAPEGCL